MSSTFKLPVTLPRKIRLDGGSVDRDTFYSWLWEQFGKAGLVGIHEGTLLSEEAAEQGLETDSWTVDSGEAPRERDWVGGQERVTTELYFDAPFHAEAARRILSSIEDLELGQVAEQKQEDWIANWRATFTGAEIAPFWKVIPPWDETEARAGQVVLRINPGAGFGTGTHETTQLCLTALGEFSKKAQLRGMRVLDFGSGSGILAIGAALLGAQVDAVEIDPLAIENATENAALNGIMAGEDPASTIRYTPGLPGYPKPYPVVLANILRPVLLEFAERLVQRWDRQGALILSGLIEKDIAEVSARYGELLAGRQPLVRELGEWRALYWGP